MNFAEVFLRLGCALVAWMVIFTHLLWLATLRVVGCNSDADQLWRLLLGFSVVTIGFTFFLNATRKLPSVHDILRWGAVPTAGLIVLAGIPVATALLNVTFGGEAICGVDPKPGWHLFWAPLQVLVMTTIGVSAWRAFQKPL